MLDNFDLDKKEYIDKDVELYIVSKNIFQVKFKDGTLINITMKKGKQKIHFIDNFTKINSDNNNN